MTRTLLALTLAASIGGCSQSHDTCAGSAPSCLRGLDGARTCCLDGPGDTAPATCRADTWVCPDTFYHRAQCAQIGAACFIDAGVPDAGGCGGPTPLCYPRVGARCCLDAPTAAACIAGSFECPRGSIRGDSCARIDPVCEGVDAGPPPVDSAILGPFDDCTMHSECVLTSAGCCDVCGSPTAADVVPVAAARESDYYRQVSCPESESGPVACPACATQPNPHLVAYCDTAPFRPVCQLADLGAPPYSPCEADSDCVLATPRCCACGEIPLSETIAVRADHAGDIDALLCELGGGECPPCVPIYDESATAACVAGACAVIGD